MPHGSAQTMTRATSGVPGTEMLSAYMNGSRLHRLPPPPPPPPPLLPLLLLLTSLEKRLTGFSCSWERQTPFS